MYVMIFAKVSEGSSSLVIREKCARYTLNAKFSCFPPNEYRL